MQTVLFIPKAAKQLHALPVSRQRRISEVITRKIEPDAEHHLVRLTGCLQDYCKLRI